jgi:hypothetical protein
MSEILLLLGRLLNNLLGIEKGKHLKKAGMMNFIMPAFTLISKKNLMKM